MGSYIETNDTLRINKVQGFPDVLKVKEHTKSPYKFEDLQGKVFKFTSKPSIRIYQILPVRNFLVEELDGKWLYWGLCHILSITHDYVKQETSGTFTIIHLNSPEQMKQAFALTDRRDDLNYFGQINENN